MTDLTDFFNERAAIKQYEAGYSRGTAEQQARIELQKLLEPLHGQEKAKQLANQIWKDNTL